MKFSIRKITTLITDIIIILVISVVLAELTSAFYYYWKNGRVFYWENLELIETKNIDEKRVTEFDTKLVLHPFLGFIRRPFLPISRVASPARLSRLLYDSTSDPSWMSLHANNYGFFSPVDYPCNKSDPREFIIGIFGGSVAHWFALQGRETLINKLQTHPVLKNRDIVVLNFAQGGFKQPQQTQILSYFNAIGQPLDAVINIDGFNELALTHINHDRHIVSAMPSAQHTLPLLNLLGSADGKLAMIDQMYALRQSERRLEWIETHKLTTRSAGWYLILSTLNDTVYKKYRSTLQAMDDVSHTLHRTDLVSITPLADKFTISESINDAFRLWQSAAQTMQKISDAAGIFYLEIVQPNQYFSNKQLSSEEYKIAINMDSIYRESIEKGYALLPAHLRHLHQKGVNIVSATAIFDHVHQPVYSDNCCHYNQIGNDIIANYIAEQMFSLYGNADPTSHSSEAAASATVSASMSISDTIFTKKKSTGHECNEH